MHARPMRMTADYTKRSMRDIRLVHKAIVWKGHVYAEWVHVVMSMVLALGCCTMLQCWNTATPSGSRRVGWTMASGDASYSVESRVRGLQHHRLRGRSCTAWGIMRVAWYLWHALLRWCCPLATPLQALHRRQHHETLTKWQILVHTLIPPQKRYPLHPRNIRLLNALEWATNQQLSRARWLLAALAGTRSTPDPTILRQFYATPNATTRHRPDDKRCRGSRHRALNFCTFDLVI